MGFHDKKSDLIREMLLKTIGRNPDLFSYFVAIQEARELLGQQNSYAINKNNNARPLKFLADG